MIGAGFIGQALTRAAVRNGHHVLIANSRGPHTLRSLAAALHCEAGTVADAAAFGEVVILAIPLHAVKQLDPSLFEGKIVLDANNYYPSRDGTFAVLDSHQATTSGLLQQRLGSGARVVKFFNAIMQEDIAKDATPKGTPGRRALPIAGDDAHAKVVAAELVDQFGFDPVDAGSLEESWRFERAMPAYCIPFDQAGLVAALASARRGVELPHGSWRNRERAT
jgi:predicted dinucleotide-binding enzyme